MNSNKSWVVISNISLENHQFCFINWNWIIKGWAWPKFFSSAFCTYSCSLLMLIIIIIMSMSICWIIRVIIFFLCLILLQYAPNSWTCQFRQLRGVASESKWQHHCIYSLWAGTWNNMTNFFTDGCRNPQKMPNYSFGIFQFLAKFLKIIVWNQNRCCWLGSVYIFH